MTTLEVEAIKEAQHPSIESFGTKKPWLLLRNPYGVVDQAPTQVRRMYHQEKRSSQFAVY